MAIRDELDKPDMTKSIERLKNSLKAKYPNHNFDIPAGFDTKCKCPAGCNGMGNITYYDNDGNIFCGRRFKQAEENNPYNWEYRECHALLRKGKQGGTTDELPF